MICFSKVCSLGGMVVLRIKVYLRGDEVREVMEILDLRDGGEGGNGFLKERGSNCLGVNVWVGLVLLSECILVVVVVVSSSRSAV